MATHDDEWLTLDEAATAFDVSRRTLERLRQRGSLPGIRRGRYLQVRRGDVDQALTFIDATAGIRAVLQVSDATPVEAWSRKWRSLLSVLLESTAERKAIERWLEETTDRFGELEVGELTSGQAVECFESAVTDGSMPLLLAALEGLPSSTILIVAMRRLGSRINPQLRP